MARKPQPGGDRNAWGALLNEYLGVAHNTDGTINPAGVQTAVATEVETALGVQLPPAVADAVAADSTVTAAAAAAIDAEPRVAQLVTDTDALTTTVTGMPAVIAGNYTKRLANYGGDIAAAIADLPDGGAGGGEIQVDGEFTLSSGNVVLPSGVQMIGRGAAATRVLIDPAYNWPGLYVNGGSDILLADMTIEIEGGATRLASQIGLQIMGAGSNILAERLRLIGLYGGVRVRGTSPGSLTDVTLRDVVVDDAKLVHGVEMSNVDNWLLDRVDSSNNRGAAADGLKIGNTTRNGKIAFSTFNNNAEEGIDGFTGAQNLTVIATTADDNSGSGAIFKTDNVSAGDPANLAPRNLHIIGFSAKGNGAHGLGVYKMNSGGTPPVLSDQVALSQVVIDGGEYIDNGFDGIYSDARNVTINHPLVRRNGRHGILCGKEALYNTISNPVSVGNGTLKATATPSYQVFSNQAANVWIQGKHISVRGGTLLGVDADTVTDEASLNALTKISTYNVFVDTFADDVLADPDFEGLAINGLGMQTNKTSGTVIFHYRTTRSYPGIGGANGSVGSTYTRVNATNGYEIRWVKRRGAPNVATGWEGEGDPPLVSALPTPNANHKGMMVTRDNGGASADTLHICVQTGASTYAWRTVTLT